MSVGHEDYGGIAAALTVAPGRFREPLDLGLGEVFASPQVLVGRPSRGNCSIYGGWRDQLQVPFCHEFRSSKWRTVGIIHIVRTVYEETAAAAI